MCIHINLWHPSKELLCRALGIGGANSIALRAASELKCDVLLGEQTSEKPLACEVSGYVQ